MAPAWAESASTGERWKCYPAPGGALRCGDVDNNCHQRIQDAPVCSLSQRRPRLPSDDLHYVVSILGGPIGLSFHSVPWRILATSAGRTLALARPTPASAQSTAEARGTPPLTRSSHPMSTGLIARRSSQLFAFLLLWISPLVRRILVQCLYVNPHH